MRELIEFAIGGMIVMIFLGIAYTITHSAALAYISYVLIAIMLADVAYIVGKFIVSVLRTSIGQNKE